MADYHGTLAAIRSLGRAGVPVETAEPSWLSSGVWSRYVQRRWRCPPPSRPRAFIDRLLEIGKRSPGRVLYATSDDVAFLYALHREKLSRYFRLYQPSVEAIYTLLNKHRLGAAAAAVGIETPATWQTAGEESLPALATRISFPVLIKPQTQILYHPHQRGLPVSEPGALSRGYRDFVAQARHDEVVRGFDPSVEHPLLQAFYPDAASSIYNLAGFIDETGALGVARASRKTLQRPRRLGVGICFESAPVLEGSFEKIAALCRHVGYHGAFEVEFIEDGERQLLLDFNPRFYGEMGFELARGMPLPLLVYQAALGRREELRRAVEDARKAEGSGAQVFVHRFRLELLLRGQRLSGGLSAAEYDQWRKWFSERRSRMVDAVFDGKDWGPGAIEVLTDLWAFARHPRSSLRQITRNDR